jgi:CDGSH-type Zn-finger protein
MKVQVTENGPYEVTGAVPLARQSIVADARGGSVDWEEGESFKVTQSYRLCRCGNSANKPFCDNTHLRVPFDGTETAKRDRYVDEAGEQDGPSVTLTDNQRLCASARFCHGTAPVWDLVQDGGEESTALAVREAQLCPSGRLIAWDRKTQSAFELTFDPSIGLVEDPTAQVSGPLWVRGGITVTSADGVDYETRNRVTLCRCGRSRNKPFCDGTHSVVRFRDDQ